MYAGGGRFRERRGLAQQAEEGPAQGGQEISLATRTRTAAQELPQATFQEDQEEEVCRGTRDWKRGKRVQLDRSYLHQWIRIQIGSVFSKFVEPDPYFEYGSGSTQVKKDRLKAKGWRLETKILPLGTQLNTKFPTALLVSCHCLLKKDVFSCETIYNSFSKLIP